MTSPAAPLASKKTGKSRCKAAREGHEEGREQGRLSWGGQQGEGGGWQPQRVSEEG